MARGWFVTATDTGAGKTLVCEALLRALVQGGWRAVGMKPVASGCDVTPEGVRSADALALLAAGNVAVDYADVNPYAFMPATAPHLAALAAGIQIDPDVIRRSYLRLATHADVVIVEGVGGWLVPIDASRTMASVAKLLDLPVVLVVGVQLGAINHALLTQESIRVQGCHIAGWVANHPAGPAPDGYLQALREHLDAPCLGIISPDISAAHVVQSIAKGMQQLMAGNSES